MFENNCERRKISRIFLCALLICLLLVWLTVSAAAETYYGTAGDGVTWVFDVGSGELRVTGERDATVPTWDIFSREIRSVTVGEGVRALPDRAFAGCANLTSVSLPESLVRIGAGAFDGCEKLSYIDYAGTTASWRALLAAARVPGGNERLSSVEPRFHFPVYRLTVHYKADDGTTVLPERTYLVTKGDSMEIESPVFEGYEADKPTVSVRNADCDVTVVVVYTRRKSQLILHYRDTEGNEILPDRTVMLAFGESISFVAPEIEGYAAAAPEYALTGPAQIRTEHTFLYEPLTYTVTVRYTDEAGKEILPATVIPGIRYGGSYRFELPEIKGYTASESSLSWDNLREDRTADAVYTATLCEVTLCFEDEAGDPVGESKTFFVRYGDAFLWSGGAPEGYELSGEVCAEQVTEDVVLTAVLNRKKYTLTVRHETPEGECLREEAILLAPGEAYRCEAISPDGYTAEALPENAQGVMPSEALTVRILYRPDGKPGDGSDPERTPGASEENPEEHGDSRGSESDGEREPEKSLISDRMDDTDGESEGRSLLPWTEGTAKEYFRRILLLVGGVALCGLIAWALFVVIRRRRTRREN